MTTCFKCGKVLPGNLRPGEYVMCRECDEKWRKTEERINKDVIEQMRNDVMKLKPFGWVFLPHPKEHDLLTIEIDKKPIVLCQDCKHYFKDDNGHVIVERCELNHEHGRKDFFCADGEKEGEEDDGMREVQEDHAGNV